MVSRRWRRLTVRAFATAWLAPAAWLLLLALLPWWLGLPLLLTVVAVALVGVERLQPFDRTLRLALRWGLPGLLVALLRWLGNDALALTIVAVAALAGFTLLAALEAWLDRGTRREPTVTGVPDDATWPSLPFAADATAQPIIELVPVQWHVGTAPLADPRGGKVIHTHAGDAGAGYRFDDGTCVPGGPARIALSPRGRWFAMQSGEDTLLWDRDRDRRHPLGCCRLYGWHHDQPWLQRGADAMPEPWRDAADKDAGNTRRE